MRRTAILIVVACSLWLAPMPAAAEPYAGLFAGAAFSERNDVDDVLAGTFTMNDVSFDTSAVFGGKVGYFFDRPIGGGSVGLELAGRVPLVDAVLTRG